MTWLAIRGLAVLGLAGNVQLLPRNAEKFRIRSAEGETAPEPAAA